MYHIPLRHINILMYKISGVVFANVRELSQVRGQKVALMLRPLLSFKFCLKFVFTKGNFAETGVHSSAQPALG